MSFARRLLIRNSRFSLPLISAVLTTTPRTSAFFAASHLFGKSVSFSSAQKPARYYSTSQNNHGTDSISTSMDFQTWSDGKAVAIPNCVMPLTFDSHKGSSGRVGVLGGSAQYTGAPYYAGMASLKAGADLAYVFCAQEACLPIKSYSPELMVAPVYSTQAFDECNSRGTNSGTSEDVKRYVI